MKKSLIAGASVMALAGAVMPMAGVFATDDNQQATDTIQITVDASCTFTTGSGTTTYSAEGTNASGPVTPVNTSSSAVHNFTVFCNNNSGYTVTAAAEALTATDITDDFDYLLTLPTASSSAADKANGSWHAAIAGTGLKAQLPDGGASTTIIERLEASGASGESFTATYSAWIGTETPAGVYDGDITYTLAPNA